MSDTITKTDQLFIRACKGRNSSRRIMRLYKMLYFGGKPDMHHILCIMGIIHEKCYKYHRRGIVSIIQTTSPSSRIYLGCDENSTHEEVFMAAIVSTLRFMPISEIEEWIYPAKYRKAKLTKGM